MKQNKKQDKKKKKKSDGPPKRCFYKITSMDTVPLIYSVQYVNNGLQQDKKRAIVLCIYKND